MRLSSTVSKHVMSDTLDLLLFFASKDFCGPAVVAFEAVRVLKGMLKQHSSNENSILGVFSVYEMILEEFGLVTDELLPPGEEQVLTINQGCRIAVLLMKNRHDQVREAGADLASQLYAMDASHECEASRRTKYVS